MISDGYNDSYWNTGDSTEASITVENNGTIHIVWMDFTAGKWGTDREIMYVNYTAATGWSNATVISDGYNDNYWNTGDSNSPAIALNNNGTIHVVWHDSTIGEWGTDIEIMYVNYKAVTGWSNASVISDGYNENYWNTGSSYFPAITIDDSGIAYVVWQDDTMCVWPDSEIMYTHLEPSPPENPQLLPLISIGYTIYLNWTNVPDATIYYIYRDTGEITAVSGLTPIGMTALNYSEDTVLSGTYYYVVIAGNSYGNSSISNCENITILPQAPVLQPLTNIGNTVFLNWTDVPDVAIYYIYRNTTEITSTTGLTPINITVLNSSVDTISSSGTYYYVIVAGNIVGNSSISNCENITLTFPPQKPILQPLTNFGNTVDLNWTDVPDATIYYIYRNTTEITSTIGLIPISMTALNSSVDIVSASGTYYYVIVAGNIIGNSSISNCENITILPQAPVLQPLTNIGNTVYLNWTDVPDATIYYIYRNNTEISSSTGLTPILFTTYNYTEDIVFSGTFFYVVIAGNSYGNSTISNCENITLTLPPLAPTLQQPTNAGNTVYLNWTNVPDATIYYIYRNTTEITSITGLTPIGTSTFNYTEDLVPSADTYYYVIVAGNSYGNSSSSICKNITIIFEDDGPDEPTSNLGWIWFVIIPLLTVIPILIFYRRRKKKIKRRKKLV